MKSEGRVAVSLAGHDIGRLYLVVKDEGKYVYVCDGKEHRLNKPKRKNKKHIRRLKEPAADPAAMTDGVLRRFLKRLADTNKRIIN